MKCPDLSVPDLAHKKLPALLQYYTQYAITVLLLHLLLYHMYFAYGRYNLKHIINTMY